MVFIDTNYFLRFLLHDVDKQYKVAKQLFQNGALGKVKLITSIIVFFEIYWVLLSFYKKRKLELAKILNDILRMTFVELGERELLQKSVEFYAKNNFDLEDAFNLVYAKENKVSSFASFDQKLTKKFSGI